LGRNILLVEGADDEHVMKHICGNRGVPCLDQVRPHGSVEKLLEAVPVELRATEEDDVVGVVLDADTSIGSRWQSIHDALIKLGYQDVPEHPDTAGTILAAPIGKPLPRMGVWIMPDNRTNGILEDFLRFLVPQPNTLFDHVETSVDAISDVDRLFSELDIPKAIIHTWLAWQSVPGRPYGTAITAQFLDANVSEVDVIVDWLKRLFFPQ